MLRRPACWLALGIVLGLAVDASGLDPDLAISQYRVDRWLKREGLPQNSVLAMAEDRAGYLWLGTQEGLARFDGMTFRSFRVEDTPELGDNYISALHAGADGTIWVGTGTGQIRYWDGDRFSRPTASDEYLGEVSAISSNGTGRPLFAFHAGGLRRLTATGRIELVSDRDGHPIDGADVIAHGPGGEAWVGGKGALFVERGGTFERIALPHLAGRRITALAVDRAGGVWIGTDESWVWRFENRGGRLLPAGDPVEAGGSIRALRVDAAGTLWIGGAGGLARIRTTARPSVEHEAGTVGVVDSLLEDRAGSLWVGTHSAGAVRLRFDEALPLGKPEGLPDDATWNVLETRDGSLWISTNGGLVRRSADRIQRIAIPGFPSGDVVALHEANDGALWAGTYGNGLFRLPHAGRPLEQLGAGEGLPPGPVTAVFEDSSGALWVGSREGLARRPAGGSFEPVPLGSGPVQIYVASILEDRSGQIWIATSDGLFVSSGGKMVREPSLRHVPLNALLFDAEGRLWAATNDRGIAVREGGRFVRIDRRHGLPAGLVLWIVEDLLGNLWLSTNHGIFRAGRADLLAVAQGRRTRIEVRLFGMGDGLRDDECSGTGQPAGWRTHDGKVWFPTASGVVAIDPRRIEPPRPPVAVLDAMSIDGGAPRPVRGQPIELPPGRGELEIRFTATGSDEADGTTFRYRLAGYDQDWVEADTRRAAFYTRLSPGTYRFSVEARHQDGGGWGPAAALAVGLAPHLHETWPFRLLAAAAATLALIGLVHLRSRRLSTLVARRTAEVSATNRRLEESLVREAELRVRAERAAAVKAEFLATVSHELRTPLNAILGLSELLRDSPLAPQQQEFAVLIRASGESLLQLVNEILDLTRVESGSLELSEDVFSLPDPFESALQLVAADSAAKGLEIALGIAPGAARRVYGDSSRLRQIVINLLANAVKFTDRGGAALWLEAVEVNGRLEVRFEVLDSGIGIRAEERERVFEPFHQAEASHNRRYGGSGLGLAIAQRMIQAMDGTITVESETGLGSTFRVTLWLRPADEAAPGAACPLAHQNVVVVGFSPPVERILSLQLASWDIRRLPPPEPFAGAARTVTSLGITSGPPRAPEALLAPVWIRLVPPSEPEEADPGELRLHWPLTPHRLAAAFERALAGVEPAMESEAPPAKILALPDGSPRLLVVEDNPVNQLVMMAMLHSLGLPATLAGGGEEALDLVAGTPYDIILLDVQMPGMDGLELTRRIRSRGGVHQPAIIAVTASAMEDDRQRCIAAGMDGYLSKPVQRAELAAVLTRFSPPGGTPAT